MRQGIFSYMLNFLVPPRKTERAVNGLSYEDLARRKIESERLHMGMLPYSQEAVRALVWELKYYANKKALALAGMSLQEELLAIAEESIGIPLLVPVPMHPKKRRKRGHNQTELLCEAALHGIAGAFEYAPRALERTRNAVAQQSLKKEKRLANVHLSMRAADTGLVRGRICVVVDDVTTTGATFREAKRALLEAGAPKVLCLALAQS